MEDQGGFRTRDRRASKQRTDHQLLERRADGSTRRRRGEPRQEEDRRLHERVPDTRRAGSRWDGAVVAARGRSRTGGAGRLGLVPELRYRPHPVSYTHLTLPTIYSV